MWSGGNFQKVNLRTVRAEARGPLKVITIIPMKDKGLTQYSCGWSGKRMDLGTSLEGEWTGTRHPLDGRSWGPEVKEGNFSQLGQQGTERFDNPGMK